VAFTIIFFGLSPFFSWHVLAGQRGLRGRNLGGDRRGATEDLVKQRGPIKAYKIVMGNELAQQIRSATGSRYNSHCRERNLD